MVRKRPNSDKFRAGECWFRGNKVNMLRTTSTFNGCEFHSAPGVVGSRPRVDGGEHGMLQLENCNQCACTDVSSKGGNGTGLQEIGSGDSCQQGRSCSKEHGGIKGWAGSIHAWEDYLESFDRAPD